MDSALGVWLLIPFVPAILTAVCALAARRLPRPSPRAALVAQVGVVVVAFAVAYVYPDPPVGRCSTSDAGFSTAMVLLTIACAVAGGVVVAAAGSRTAFKVVAFALPYVVAFTWFVNSICSHS